jgi:B12-binding domain/radical SAM domain protein
MSAPVLILLHAPTVYDFRQSTILRGPTSDLIPSSSVFEMYPLGFVTIAAHLEANGYPVRIINLATRMLRDSAFDAEAFIAQLPKPLAFGIDLHWLPHAQGALAIAQIVKDYHPDVPVLFGGFSSTYYHEELVTYPQVDFVLRGDSTEGAARVLMESLANGDDLSRVPNLTWRDSTGQVHVNPLQHSPSTLDSIDLDFRQLMLAAVRDQDLLSYIPFMGWLEYPIMPVVSCRGCTRNCVGCGGSKFAFQHMHGRTSPVYRPPEKLAEDVRHIASISNAPIFVIGDIRQAGKAYVERFLGAVSGIQTPVMIELFWPASREFMAQVASALPDFAIELSIESHDLAVRHAFGKPYSNAAVESTIRHALDLGARRFDLFFMVGLPRQTYEIVLGSADYTGKLLNEFGADQRLRPFIGPMAPFVDPGSLAFEQPEQHGYQIFYRTLEEHRKALLEPGWQFTLNYETRWMTRHEIVHSTYEACIRFADLKVKHGLIDAEDGARVQHTLKEGRRLSLEIERLRDSGQSQAIEMLKPEIEHVNTAQGAQEKRELRLPAHSFKWLRLIAFVLSSNIWRRWMSNSLDRLRRTLLPASHPPAQESGQSR